MTDQPAARVDVATLRDAAGRFDTVAALAGNVARARLGFGAATAGRAHTADGDAVRRTVDDVVTGMAGWARAAEEIAAGLRAALDRLADADRAAAVRIG